MKTLSENKRVFFDYEFLEKFKAGIKLTGHETKSAKMGKANIAGAYAVCRNGEIFLIGAEISSFQPQNSPFGYDPKKTRKLLLTKKEIGRIAGKIQSNLTILPLKIYTERGFVKVDLGLGRKKREKDKRELIKKRDAERTIRNRRTE